VKTRQISHNDAPRWGLGRFCSLLGGRSFIAPRRTVSHQIDSRVLRLALRFSADGLADSPLPGPPAAIVIPDHYAMSTGVLGK